MSVSEVEMSYVLANLLESLKNNNFFAGYSSYLGKSRYSNSNIKPNEELKLTLKFETISSDLPAKLHLELCDQSGRVLAFVLVSCEEHQIRYSHLPNKRRAHVYQFWKIPPSTKKIHPPR